MTQNKKEPLMSRLTRAYTKDMYSIMREYYRSKGIEDDYIEYRRQFETIAAAQLSKPLEIRLELNNYCNMLCAMCYRNYHSYAEKVDLTDELLDSIINEAKALSIPAIHIGSNAEGTLHPNASGIIKKIGAAGFLDFWMITNGSQLGEDLLDVIIEAPVTRLTVSLDAVSQQTYEKIRGNRVRLEEVESNIGRLLRMRDERKSKLPLLRVTFVDAPENCHEKQQFIDKWKDVADIVDIQAFYETSTDESLRKETKINMDYMCRFPFKSLVIGCDGELKPCDCAVPTYPMQKNGPVYLGKDYSSILEYWNSEWHRALCESLAVKKYLPECEACNYRRT